MQSDDIRRWVVARRAAEARERAEAREHPPSAESTIRGALALVALAGRLHGWPPQEDVDGRRDDARGYERWSRLRAFFGKP